MAHFSLSAIALSFLLLLFSLGALAQDTFLMIQGGFEDATATDESYNTGGTIVVNGFNIQVPKNLQIQFPAAYVPFKDFVAAKSSMIGYEIQVMGNTVDGVPIAGQILAYQFFEGLASGYIESIDIEDGTMKIQNGPVLRISDPNAVFSKGFSDFPFFTADDQNPSISSFSGFPMCIPRNSSDPLCPSNNRPAGSGTFNARDPLVMAPFMPGDWVEFMGIRKGNEVVCFSIVAWNVMITTLNDLVYLRVEEIRLGISNFSPNTELAESRWTGFASNSRTRVAIYAMDIDPCTGAVTDRIIAALGLRNTEQNLYRFDSDVLSGYARDYRVVAEINGRPATRQTKNGLLAGQYVSPVAVWIQGEQNVPGTQPPANDFSQFPWLTQGIGIDADGNLWGPLEPFPQTGVIIEAPDCGDIAQLRFQGDEIKQDWQPSSELADSPTMLNGTETDTSQKRRRKVQGRYMSRKF